MGVVCVCLGGLGILPPTLDSQTVRVPSFLCPHSLTQTPLLMCGSVCVCLFAAVTGHNPTSPFELEKR